MASEKQPEQTPVRLELARVDTIHVSTGSQKVATICLVLKDSDQVEDLLDNPMPIPKMVITEVVPLKEDPNKAEVFFRNLTTEELIDTNRRMLMPSGSLEEIFGDLFGTLGGNTEIHAEIIDLTDEEEDILNETANDLADDVTHVNSLGELFETLGAKLPVPQASSNTHLYSVVVSLAEAHLAQVLCVGTNAPAFVLTSEGLIDSRKSEKINEWEDFIAVLEFPYPDTSEYFDSTALLIQAVTGSFPLNLTIADINLIRGELLSQVIRMSNGSSNALVESFSFINPMNKTSRHQEDVVKPEKLDGLNLFRQDAINKLYEMTSPHVISALTQELPYTQQHVEDIQVLDELFQNSGLDSMFEEILQEEYSNKEFRLASNPSREELMGFYSTPITADTFPAAMSDLVRKIQMPLLYDYNWAGGNVDLESTSTNVGEISVARLITVAVRLARLSEMTEAVPAKFVPIALLLQGLNFPGEPSIWAFLEGIRLLSGNDEDRLVFDTLIVAGLPKDGDDKDIAPEEILPTPAATIMHRLGHAILDEGWSREIILSSITEETTITDFVNTLFDTIEEFRANSEGGEPDHTSGKPCPVMMATYQFFTRRPSSSIVVQELGNLIKALAELNGLKNTDITKDTKEWKEYIQLYLQRLFAE